MALNTPLPSSNDFKSADWRLEVVTTSRLCEENLQPTVLLQLVTKHKTIVFEASHANLAELTRVCAAALKSHSDTKAKKAEKFLAK
eukprot:CAMPEP_0204918464 /NCGR_PEP_ID=MMETSP1397-20131031/16172_1 /ASSEMBLY_ACC=CAM_ASM_000891 /TAXON_ID=49980 /ORGANISM="Climacostomum Climacostomum virens, Strain Stock W-24" /LENGTH=85 /DNA_ID=CAMNT_0052091763 /DNA_START=1 /DNA_END=255 /DNA_ORIENTATION=+